MKPENRHNYITCRNCGKYISLDRAVNQLYCCRECAIVFRRCVNCGRYFIPGEAASRHCSPACATVYKLKTPQKNLYEDFRFGSEET